MVILPPPWRALCLDLNIAELINNAIGVHDKCIVSPGHAVVAMIGNEAFGCVTDAENKVVELRKKYADEKMPMVTNMSDLRRKIIWLFGPTACRMYALNVKSGD